jgi:hypothetical protein
VSSGYLVELQVAEYHNVKRQFDFTTMCR